MAVETPAYEVLIDEGEFELRRYAAYLVANVHVAASGYGQAATAGFNPLADYIFGNNREADSIAMTAPVSTARAAGGRKIAMTAPVTATHSEDDYVVSFTMPSDYSMDALPQPNNPRVSIGEVGPHQAAVIRFSGYVSDKGAAQKMEQLGAWMARHGLVAEGEPVVAQYDAPWKPWFARRNEILIPVADDESQASGE